MSTAVKPVPIHAFVAQLRQFPEPSFDQTEQLRRFLQDAPVDPDSLAPYLTWDRQHYTRNLIDKTPLYELLAICWEVGQASSVHNHRDQNCWMAVPTGRLLVENFHVVHQDIAAGKCAIKSTETIEMNVSTLRRRPTGARSPGPKPARFQPARRQPPRILPPLRYLRRLLRRTGHLWRN